MKIQKNEIEFITFDAKDVIVTSGVFGYFQVTAALYPNHKDGYKGNGVWEWGSDFDLSTSKLLIEGLAPVENGYYQLVGGTSAGGVSSGVFNLTGVEATTEKGKKGDVIDSLQGILSWLTENGAKS